MLKFKKHTQRDNAMLSPDKLSNHATLSDCHLSDNDLNYDDMVTYDNIKTAYLQTIKGKQHRFRVQQFKQNFVTELTNLYKELKSQTYKPQPHREFKIWCTAGQKTRTINAPTLRDLVVQRLIYNYIYNTFDKGFIHDSYGCRKQKGVHKSADRTQQFIRQSPKDTYYLQIDIYHYYYNIKKDIIRQSLERKIKDDRIINLTLMFMSDTGVNVGSILAQLFGLIYLDRFDHFIKRHLKIKRYIRYVDDMIFIGLNKNDCFTLLNTIKEYLLTNLNLTLSKWKIKQLKSSINFCGYRTFKTHRLVRKRSLKTFNRTLKHKDYKALESILAHAQNTSSYSYLISKLTDLNSLPNHLFKRIEKWHSTHSLELKAHTVTV